jgi:hypothetical protein
MPILGHICYGTRARAAKCWNLGSVFTPKNKSQFSIMQTDFCLKIWNLETICNRVTERLFDCFVRTVPIWLQSCSKNAKFYGKICYRQNMCGFCREENSKNSGRDGQNFGHLVQPVTKDLRDHRYPSVLPQ